MELYWCRAAFEQKHCKERLRDLKSNNRLIDLLEEMEKKLKYE